MSDARAIATAAERGDLEEVRRLVQQDHQLLDAEWNSYTPLKAAAWKGRVEVVRYLLDEGADINLRPLAPIAHFSWHATLGMLTWSRCS
jgi:ankyrin repeat protein